MRAGIECMLLVFLLKMRWVSSTDAKHKPKYWNKQQYE